MYRGTFTLIGSEMSMFTRKLEAQLRYQGIPYKWRFKTMEEGQAIEQRGGTRFIPLLETPDGWVINDTIVIGPMLSSRFEDTAAIPDTPAQRGLCFVLEDYYNHWMPRYVLHSRWCYEDSVEDAGKNFGSNMILGKSISEERTPEEEEKVAQMGSFMRDSFGKNACEVQGAGPDQSGNIQEDYRLMMSQLNEHFKHYDYLLGERACLADFALIGSCVAHFLQDPAPRSWLGEYESMLENYVDRGWNGSPEGKQWMANDEIPESLTPIIEHAKNNYQVFALASIEAAARGEKHYSLDLGKGEFTGRSMKRLDKARLHVQDEILSCGADETPLAETGALDFYMKPPIV